jgi:hypothetical protein
MLLQVLLVGLVILSKNGAIIEKRRNENGTKTPTTSLVTVGDNG